MSGGARLLAFRPTLADYILKMKRGAQVVYPKDIGLILVYADIVVRVRSWSKQERDPGSLTLALSRAVGEQGRVISYEVRQDHLDQAVENVAGLVRGQRRETGEPRTASWRRLRGHPGNRCRSDSSGPARSPGGRSGPSHDPSAPGGSCAATCPRSPRYSRSSEPCGRPNFVLINTFEGLVRTWNIDGQSVRPDHRMVAHTGFIVSGGKRQPWKIRPVREPRE